MAVVGVDDNAAAEVDGWQSVGGLTGAAEAGGGTMFRSADNVELIVRPTPTSDPFGSLAGASANSSCSISK